MKPQTAPNGSQSEGLSPRQEAAALALATGATIQKAAKKAGCGARTIRTWLAEQLPFRRRVADLRGQLTERTLGLLAAATADAVMTLRVLCRKGKTESARLRAADSLLVHDVRQREVADLRHALDEMRERLGAVESRRRRPR